jgi:hypothetical protein
VTGTEFFLASLSVQKPQNLIPFGQFHYLPPKLPKLISSRRIKPQNVSKFSSQAAIQEPYRAPDPISLLLNTDHISLLSRSSQQYCQGAFRQEPCIRSTGQN